MKLSIAASLRGPRSKHEVADLKAASELYAQIRDDSGEGASTFPFGKLVDADGTIYRVSYNAKVWLGDELVYNPYV